MTYRTSAQTPPGRISLLVGLLTAAALAVALGYPLLTTSSPPPAAPVADPRSEPPQHAVAEVVSPTDVPPPTRGSPAPPRPQPPPRQAAGEAAAPGAIPRGERRGALGPADGVVPDGTTVFDDIPGVANLHPALLAALRQAAADAENDGIAFSVNSGWRSPAYQDQLLREAVATYGSEEEAARWVATAATSPHVAGAAIDLGPFDATAWLSARGAAYGLCQIYGNEPWHYELRPEAIDAGCPPMYADPTDDPRMQP